MAGRWALGWTLASSLLALACGPGEPVAGSASEGLVFVRSVGETTDLFRARLSDGDVVQLTDTPQLDESLPLWVGARSVLILSLRSGRRAERGEGGFRLMVLDPRSGATSTLSPSLTEWEAWATVSPAGDQIAYSFRSPPGAPVPGGVLMRHLGNREAELLANLKPPVSMRSLDFSGDGKTVVAQRHRKKGGDDLVLLRPREKPKPIQEDPTRHDAEPRFTRDSAGLVFTRRHTARSPGEVLWLHLDGSGLDGVEPDPRADDHSPAPSPTRDEVVFVSDRDGSPDLLLATLGEARLRKLTSTPDETPSAPRWSPDGEKIAFVSTPAKGEDRRPRVVVIDREGRRLFETEGHAPAWMPPWQGSR